MLARAAFPSFFLTLTGFILQLLVTLSVPVIKTIELLHIESSGGTTAANIGVFGECFKGGDARIGTISYSHTAACTSPSVGYTLPSTYFGESPSSQAQTVIIRGLAGSLILNPIAAGFAGVSLFFAVTAWFCSSRISEIITFLTLFLSSLSAWVAFWLDLALVLIAHHRVNDYTNGGYTAHVGNALWMALAGALAMSFAICFAGCGVFGRYSSHHNGSDRAVAGTPSPNEKGYERRRFWQRAQTYRGTY